MAHLGNFEFDLAHQSVHWSDEVYRIFGIEPGETISLERYRRLMPPNAFERVMQLVAGSVSNGEPYELEHPIVLPDGTTRFVFAMGHPVRDERGEVQSIFGVVQDITERRRVEDALRRSEALLGATARLGRTGGWEFHVAGARLLWTETVKEIHEVPPDYVPSLERSLDFYAPEHVSTITAATQRALAGEAYDLELQIVTATGQRRWVRTIGKPVYEGGQLVGLLGIFQDIEERRRAELRHQAEEERLRFLDELHEATRDVLDAQQILRIVTTMLGRHLGASRCGWARFDLAARTSTIEAVMEAPGLPVSVHGTVTIGGWGAHMLEQLSRGQTLVLRDMPTELAGDPAVAATWQAWGTAAFVACPVLSQGRLEAMLAVDSHTPRDWSDVELRLIEQVAQRSSATIQRALAESALRHSEATLREAQRVAGVGSFEWDARSQAVEWSDELFRIFGVDPEATRDPADRARAMAAAGFGAATQALRSAVESGSSFTGEQHVTLPDGTRRQLHLLGRPLRGPDGQLQRILGTVQDVTARVHTEARLRAALREKDILLKEIYHRVKNNLQVVSSLLMLQSHQPAAGDVGTLLAESSNRVKSMALVHEQLYQQSDLSSIDFARYLAQLASHLGEAYADVTRRVRLRLDAQPVVLGIETAVPLGLIVNELLSNAYKHAFPAGRGGEVRVRLRAPVDGALELEVSDDGIGLPAGLQRDGVSSLGMQLVASLAHQIDATLEWPPSGSPGARFTLRFVPELAEPARLRA